MSKPTPELNEIEIEILQALRDESNEADEAADNGGVHIPILDYYEGDTDWEAAKRLAELGLVQVEQENTLAGQGHLVLRESYKGSELLED